MRKFEYCSRTVEIEVESEYKLDKDDFIYYKDDLIAIFNNLGAEGFEVISWQIDGILQYDEQDIRDYHTDHDKPFTRFTFNVILKREIGENIIL